jgi:hypothetical protein
VVTRTFVSSTADWPPDLERRQQREFLRQPLRASADRRARMDTGDASRRRFGLVTRANVRITETMFPLVRAYPRGL